MSRLPIKLRMAFAKLRSPARHPSRVLEDESLFLDCTDADSSSHGSIRGLADARTVADELPPTRKLESSKLQPVEVTA